MQDKEAKRDENLLKALRKAMVAYRRNPVAERELGQRPKPKKNREDLIEDYRRELVAGGWPREQRKELLLKFRRELVKRGVV